MAKRKMLFHPDYVREKIRASQLINRLHKCAFGWPRGAAYAHVTALLATAQER
jgi:hypothetical protein